MSLADRDYLREPRNDRGPGSPRRRRAGLLGLFSFNTWLIIANVVVFFLGASMFNAPPLQRPMFGAPQFESNVPMAGREDDRVKSEAYWTKVFQAKPSDFRNKLAFGPFVEIFEFHDDGRGQVFVVPVGKMQVSMVAWSEYWGHFSTRRIFSDLEVWRFVTFQFLHSGLSHLVFNMMGLWFVGGLVEEYLGSKRYAAYYLVCGIFGAVSYLVLNFLGNYVLPGTHLPGLLFDDPGTPLVGASAGIFGVLMAAAYIAPNEIIQIMGVFPARMKPAVYLFTLAAALNLVFGTANAGGEAAHIGGAIAGYFFIRRTHLLRDFFDIFGSSRPAPPGSSPPTVGEINRILDKIRTQGMQSLTPGERDLLENETKRRLREGIDS